MDCLMFAYQDCLLISCWLLMDCVSTEPEAVCVGEFEKERKRGGVKRTKDVLTTAHDSEHVEKWKTKTRQKRFDSCVTLTRYCMWVRVIVRREARGVKKREGTNMQVKERGKWATEIVCLLGSDKWGFYSRMTDRQIGTSEWQVQ